jgi:molecular chaperone GrpE
MKPAETGASSLPPAHDEQVRPLPAEESPVQAEPSVSDARPKREPDIQERREPDEAADWRDLALRLQAEMDNYRKRQQRLAQEQIESARLELLLEFLPVLDNLERALAAPEADASAFRDGVRLTHREMLQRLHREGVEQIQALDQPFDPNWHEAVSAVPHDGRGIVPGTVVKVLEPGYHVGDRLLRPARVIVAV